LLKVEQQALLNMRQDEKLQQLVGILEECLRDALLLPLGADHFKLQLNKNDFPPQVLLDLMLLQTWKTPHVAQLDFSDMVHGKSLHAGQSAEEGSGFETTVPRLLREYLSQHFRDVDVSEADHQHHQSLVMAQLAKQKMGLRSLYDLFEKYNVKLTAEQEHFFQEKLDILSGCSTVPPGENLKTVDLGALLSDIQEKIYFGNHQSSFSKKTKELSPSKMGLTVNGANQFFGQVQAGLKWGISEEKFFRSGGLSHGCEPLMVGQRKETQGDVGLGGGGGKRGNALLGFDYLRFRFSTYAQGWKTHRKSETHATIIRAPRLVVEEQADAVNPVFKQNDEHIREISAQLLKLIFSRAENALTDETKEKLFKDVVAYCFHNEMSWSFTHQKDQAQGYKLVAGSSAGLEGGEETVGVRFPFTASADIGRERVSHRQTETVGSFQVNQSRFGWAGRCTISASTSLCAPLFSALAEFAKSGVSVQCRVVKHQGLIVPEKTFLDTATPSLSQFQHIVDSVAPEILEKFELLFRGEPDAKEQAQTMLNEFMAHLKTVRTENDNYYVRARMHPDAAAKLDQLECLSKALGASKDVLLPFHHEILQKREEISMKSFSHGSLVADQLVQKTHDWLSLSPLGLKVQLSAGVMGKHEFGFLSAGWAWWRQRERENPLDAQNRGTNAHPNPSRTIVPPAQVL
jgi:hypothetical protein